MQAQNLDILEREAAEILKVWPHKNSDVCLKIIFVSKWISFAENEIPEISLVGAIILQAISGAYKLFVALHEGN